MRNILAALLALFFALSAGAALADGSNQGGGPGNSGPGDKNSQNEQGHGGVPPK
jgi:hypothetical protein